MSTDHHQEQDRDAVVRDDRPAAIDRRVAELAEESIRDIRSAATAWGDISAEDRRERIRSYLLRTANGASIEPRSFAALVIDLLPSGGVGAQAGLQQVSVDPTATSRATSTAPAPEPPADPVEHILELVSRLSDDGRKRLVAALRANGTVPPEEQRLQPASAPVGRVVASGGGAQLGDDAFMELLDGLAIRAAGRPPGVEPESPARIAEAAADAARLGFRRADLSMDSLAIALAHCARAIGEFSEEQGSNPRGLPETIRQVLPHTSRSPVGQIRDYLVEARNCDSPMLRRYLEDFFEPYRELSERLPRLSERLNKAAEQLNPRVIEEKAPKSFVGTVAYDKIWESYRLRYEELASKGFGVNKDQTRAWLFRQWLT